jgi:hypothetical protein
VSKTVHRQGCRVIFMPYGTTMRIVLIWLFINTACSYHYIQVQFEVRNGS